MIVGRTQDNASGQATIAAGAILPQVAKWSTLIVAGGLLLACQKSEPEVSSAAGEPIEVEDPTCDIEKLDALAQDLSSAAPMRRRELVGEGLAKACKQPVSFVDFVASTQLDRVREVRLSSLSGAGAQTELVCPTWTDVSTARLALPGAQRHAEVYEKCKLERFGLIDAQAWRDTRSSSLVPFAVAAWLQKNGASKETSTTIAKAMLLRDRQIWSKSEQTLTSAVYPLPAVPHGPLLHVTTKAIELDGEELCEIEAELSQRWRTLLPLALEDMAQKHETAVLVADASSQASLLDQLVETIAEAGIHSVALVAQNRPLEFGAAMVQAHVNSDTIVRLEGGDLRLEHGGNVQSIKPKSEADAVHDYAELARRLEEKTAGAPLVVSISVDKHVKTEVLLNTLSTLYEVACGSAPAECTTPPKIGFHDRTVEIAMNSGILGVLSAESGAGVFGSTEVFGGGLEGAGLGSTSLGEGGTGLIGSGGGGGLGTIGIRGGGTHGKPVPRVRMGKANVEGGLDKDIVRRIVRAHINEVRACYKSALDEDEDLEDLVTITFTIDAAGKIESASAKSDESNTDLAKCIAKAVRVWKFPKPAGGTVEVSYPFTLVPG